MGPTAELPAITEPVIDLPDWKINKTPVYSESLKISQQGSNTSLCSQEVQNHPA
jgi:hypothetical protein